MNVYDTLGVRPDATLDEIKKAYRALARRTHPDTGGEAMKPLFLSVTAAWELLSDPARRAEYDRANGLNTHVQPEPEPETFRQPPARTADEYWEDVAAKFDAAAEEKKPKRDRRARRPRSQPPAGPAPAWREVFAGTVQRRRRHPLPAAAAVLFTGWAVLVWILAGREQVLSGPEGVLPQGTGMMAYAAGWAVGLWLCCHRVRRGLSIGWGPLAGAAVGALAAYSLNSAEPLLSAAALAAGFAVSLAAASWFRRTANLDAVGQGPQSSKLTVFSHPGQSSDEAAAQNLTRAAFAELLAAPGMRYIESALVRGRPVSAILVNGSRAAVIDSRLLPDWIHEDFTGDLEADAPKLLPNLESTISADVAALRSNVRAVRGWLVIHPSRSGSVDLKPVRGAKISAAAPAAAMEEIGRWLAEGSRAGTVNPDLVYRVLRGTSPMRSR